MKQLILPLEAGAKFIENFHKNPFPCAINVVPPIGKATICPGKDTLADGDRFMHSDEYNVVPTYHEGGTLVFFEDQIVYAVFDVNRPPSNRKKIVDFLRKKGIDAKYAGNDIVCDGYKVCGEMCYQLKDIGYWYYALYISISMDADLVNKASSKPMIKPPRGLSYYGITRQEMLELLGISDE